MTQCVCYIEDGRIANPEVIRKQFSALKDGVYLVKISNGKTRSGQQNAYYWGVVCELVKDGLMDAGFEEVHSSDDAHEILKGLFLKKETVSRQTGEVLTGARSTTELTTVEFNDYVEMIQRWAAEYLGINIPSPNE